MPIPLSFIPLTKADTAAREVWGIAAVEEPDVHREILDYALSKPNFVAWSERMRQVTDGKSLGNVRAMHKGALAAVGKVIHFEPLDDKKAFFIGAKIVDDEAWQKVQEGIYTGFSVGGRYGQRFPDAMLKGYTRYEALPSEISLVDMPAAPNARFELIKADGMSENRPFAALAKGESLDERVNRVRGAWYDRFGGGDPLMMACCVIDVQTDQVIVDKGQDGMFAYPYNQDEAGNITFGDPAAVEKQYVLKKGMNMDKVQEILSQMESSDSQDMKALAAQLKAALAAEDNTETAEGEAPDGESQTQANGQEENETSAESEAGAAPEGQGLSADAVKEIVIGLLEELGLVQRQGAVAQKADFTGELQKSLHTYGSTLGEFEAGIKRITAQVESLETLQKSLDGFQAKTENRQSEILADLAKVAAGAESLHTRLETLEKRGAMGPVLREVPMLPAEQQLVETLKKMAADTDNPALRQQYQAEIARIGIKAVQTQS